MCDTLKCEVVRDLLPNYIEELTSAETNDAVYRHMERCEACKKLHEKLKADMAVPKFEKKDLLRLLRAIRKARLTHIILAVLGSIVLMWSIGFVLSAPLSPISPEEIAVQNIYELSNGSLVIEYKVRGMDRHMIQGQSATMDDRGDYAFEMQTNFWNRLFGAADPEYEVLYSKTGFNPEGQNGDAPLIIYYGYGRDKKELWRKGEPVIKATEEFEMFARMGFPADFKDYLWRLSVTEPAPTLPPDGYKN